MLTKCSIYLKTLKKLQWKKFTKIKEKLKSCFVKYFQNSCKNFPIAQFPLFSNNVFISSTKKQLAGKCSTGFSLSSLSSPSTRKGNDCNDCDSSLSREVFLMFSQAIDKNCFYTGKKFSGWKLCTRGLSMEEKKDRNNPIYPTYNLLMAWQVHYIVEYCNNKKNAN